MKTLFKIVLLSFLVSIAFPGVSQPALVLTLDDAVNFAIDHNKTLINSRYAINKSSQKIKEAIAAGLPQINASVDYTTYLGAQASIQLSPASPPATIEFNPTSNLQASVTQLIFNGNYYVGIQLSKLAKKMTEQNYRMDALDVKEQTIQAYYLVLANERILNIIRENKANAQVIYEKTNNLVNAGILEETDIKKLSVMVTTVDNQIKSTERQLELGYNLLRLYLGLESNQMVRLASSLDEIADRYIFNIAVADTFRLDNNLNYQLLLMQTQLAKKNITMNKASYLPTLAAYYLKFRTERII